MRTRQTGKHGCLSQNEISDALSEDGCMVGMLIMLGVFLGDERRALVLTGRYLCVFACADAVVYQARIDVNVV